MRFAPYLTPPYYAVIFTSQRRLENTVDDTAYEQTAERMVQLASEQAGFLGVESVRDADGFGITVSYWQDEYSIQQWRNQVEHLAAQKQGRSNWYEHYELRVAKVERARQK